MKDIDKRVSIIAKACNDKKGFDIKVLNLKKLTTIADYFIIASGNSTTQVKAITDEIEQKMEEAGFYLQNKEGHRSARWVLLDFGDIVTHVFHKEDREFYNLEKLWADGEELVLDGIL
ncbi:MAG: ribosome silencing factor [Tissierellia bacterium]|nr:ribosome silencing factor [Tissierellia bacterium]